MTTIYKDQYWKHLDALRAIAVMAVLFFHFKVPGFRAGYLGVDIFFTISGFLITRLILKELRETGKLRFGRFLKRRIRRLFPALLVSCVVTTILAYIFLDAERLAAYGKSVTAAIISLSNIQFWLGSGYFDTASHTKPLLHTWSLSVEEQFYIIWPLTLAFGYRILKNKTLLILSIGAFCFSILLIALWMCSGFDPKATSTVFYWMPFRVYEFMLGAIALLIFDRIQKSHTNLQNTLAILGTLLIIGTIILSANTNPVLGPVIGGIACLGAALVILAPNAVICRDIYSWQPFRWVGKISYSLYLVHWPIWVFWPAAWKHMDYMWIILVGLSVLVTLPLHYGIEKKFRTGRHSLKIFGVSALSIVAAGAVLANVSTLPFRAEYTLSAEQIKDGLQARYKIKKCIIHMLDSQYCHLDRPKQVLTLGNSHEVDGFNTFHGIYGQDDSVNLIAFGSINKCDLRFENETISSDISARDCDKRAAALNGILKTPEKLSHIIYSSNFPYSNNKINDWKILKYARKNNIKIITLGGFLNTNEECSVIVNRHKNFSACLLPEYTKAFPFNEMKTAIFNHDFDYLYIDRIKILCGGQIADCPYIGLGEPMMNE